MAKANLLFGALVLSCVPTLAWGQCQIEDYHQADTVDGPFTLRVDYPAPSDDLDSFVPKTHFEHDWQAYLYEALDYAWAGQAASGFRAEANTVRNWYHAPWLHAGHAGRDRLQGLTRERPSRAEELQPGVRTWFDNWGIGFFNEAAAAELGKIWTDFCNPSPDALQSVDFPEGSVSLKVLFSEASGATITALEGAPTRKADIHADGYFPTDDLTSTNDKACKPGDVCPRNAYDVTLLQVDIAIKDARATGTGWVFGTFVYDRTKKATHDEWDRLSPISISWGNDEDVLPGNRLAESHINTAFENVFYGWSGREHMGWGGRANGPVDNPASGCMSCHGSAQFPAPRSGNWPGRDQAGFTDEQLLATYFRNTASGELTDPDSTADNQSLPAGFLPVALDYSLQTQMGLENMCDAWATQTDVFANGLAKPDICPDRPAALEALVQGNPEMGVRIQTFDTLRVTQSPTARRASKGDDFGR